MPSIEENRAQWDSDSHWQFGGDDWSGPWGGVEAQWFGSIYPRVRRFVPATRILEIAPGFGRWTEFLLKSCDELAGVDVASTCIKACQARFAGITRASFHANDGHSLPMVADGSIDFAFSFDSLVHVEADVIGDYLTELARCLTPDGVAFLHHSNYGAYHRSARILAPVQPTMDRLPPRVRKGLERVGLHRGLSWRAPSMSAERFCELSEAAGLRCTSQELVNWTGGFQLIDCMSVITRPGSRWDHPRRVVRNHLFRLEARAIRRSAAAYC